MVELFMSKGMEEDDATQIINLYSKYPTLYVDLMMYEELGMMPPGNGNPAIAGAWPADRSPRGTPSSPHPAAAVQVA